MLCLYRLMQDDNVHNILLLILGHCHHQQLPPIADSWFSGCLVPVPVWWLMHHAGYLYQWQVVWTGTSLYGLVFPSGLSLEMVTQQQKAVSKWTVTQHSSSPVITYFTSESINNIEHSQWETQAPMTSFPSADLRTKIIFPWSVVGNKIIRTPNTSNMSLICR